MKFLYRVYPLPAVRIERLCAATNLIGSNWKTTTLYGATLFYDYKENYINRNTLTRKLVI